jgi:glycosyltransferase involved in cell wall biosynthesis
VRPPIGDDPASGTRLPSIAFLATYVPRQCGIATFTRDLVEGLRADGRTDDGIRVVALERRGDRLAYPPVVRHRLSEGDRAEYRRLAATLEADGVEVVCIQHEYGIFGGPSGAHLLDFVDALTVPVVTTLHTILAHPTPLQRRILERLAERSARLVSMSERGRAILVDGYGVPVDRVEVVPHGVPDFPALDPTLAKVRIGVGDGPLILSFGLLGPHKRLGLVIDALARIGGDVPEAHYAVVGATHPEIRRRTGETYREELAAQAARLGLEGRVLFVDRYVDDAELATWLSASDIFVTPYGNAQQITSGTLAYAIAAGAAVISTPYEHAIELLGDGRGILVPFDDADALAEALTRLLADEGGREALRRRARALGRTMIWPRVAERYSRLFAAVVTEQRRPEREPVVIAIRPASEVAPSLRPDADGSQPPLEVPVPGLWPALAELPAPSDSDWLPETPEDLPDDLPTPEEVPAPARRHLDEMSDRVGIFQFARGRRPDPNHGYCTDDIARALRVDLRHAATAASPALATATRRELAFLQAAFDPATGRFRNFRANDGHWPERTGSEDAHGRAVQALGEAIAKSHDRGVVTAARQLFAAALPAAFEFGHARPWAYALLGCAAALDDPLSARHAGPALAALAERLVVNVEQAATADSAWPWPETSVTYDNGIVPEALVIAGVRLERPELVTLGTSVLDWLLVAETGPEGRLRPVGNRGWWPHGGRPAPWDQQPIEPESLVFAAAAALEATGEAHWAQAATRAYRWFLSVNDHGIALADPDRGACRDGLGADGANRNEGAESTLAWLLSVERIRELRQGRSKSRRRSGLGQDRMYVTTSDSRAVATATLESAAP